MPKQLPKKLPPKRSIDHRIEIYPGSNPLAKVPYRLSQDENQELKKQLNELLEAGFIQPSKSPYGALVLFVKKKEGDLRLCVTSNLDCQRRCSENSHADSLCVI